MEEGGQPVVIGGSDSEELDKFQRQRDRALHKIQCLAFNFDLRADRDMGFGVQNNGGNERAL
jgi:hypothetical protein